MLPRNPSVAKAFDDALAPHGIAIFEVRPGIIATDMTAPVKDKYDRLIAGGLKKSKKQNLNGNTELTLHGFLKYLKRNKKGQRTFLNTREREDN